MFWSLINIVSIIVCLGLITKQDCSEVSGGDLCDCRKLQVLEVMRSTLDMKLNFKRTKPWVLVQ